MDPDEFPDPDEEFEMRYADEFELMQELGTFVSYVNSSAFIQDGLSRF